MHAVLPALAAMLATQILTSMSGTAAPVLAPAAAPELGVELYLVGVYVAIVYGTGALSSAFCTGLIPRFGALRVSQVCLLLCGVGLVLVGSGRLTAIAVGAFLIGLAYGPAPVASSHVLARLTPPAWMNLVFSVKQTGVPLGTGLSGVLMPVLALALGWRGAVLVGAAICMAAAVVLQPLRAALDADRDPTRKLLAIAHLLGPLRLVLSDPDLRRLSLVSFVYAGMQTTLSAFLVAYLAGRLGFTLVLAGIVLAVSQASGALGRVIWGMVADRWGQPVRLLAGLGVAMSIASVLTGLFTSTWPWLAIVLVCVAFGATAAGWNGVFLAQMARMAPSGRVSDVAGGASFLTYGGVMVIPPLFSAILAATGSYTTGFSAIALLTLGGGIWILVRPTASTA
jgi:MFS family permease